MENLDYICMECAQKIVSGSNKYNLENSLRKALGILQEDGIYAMFLWIEGENKKEIRKKIIEHLLRREIIEKYFKKSDEFNGFSDDDFGKFCEDLKTVLQSLDNLLFMKKILERTLTYALYHAKIGDKK